MGDFDGSSAWELINSLKAHRSGIDRVFIHTNGLRDVHPFGLGILQNYFSDFVSRPVRVVFTGEKAYELTSGTTNHKKSKLGVGPVGEECISIKQGNEAAGWNW